MEVFAKIVIFELHEIPYQKAVKVDFGIVPMNVQTQNICVGGRGSRAVFVGAEYLQFVQRSNIHVL